MVFLGDFFNFMVDMGSMIRTKWFNGKRRTQWLDQ
jgi:hypothetical protein